MKHYIGIDLGTTNSVICSYDGSSVRLWKSPEQSDVTPSALYFDRRGNKYVGKTAYDKAPHDPDNAAMLFKRFMGTSTPVNIAARNLVLTPEQCSAEVLKVLFGYLPEEIRNSGETGTVITVPAAFNQMQRDATMDAADLAGIGQVALMQEPVAAIMSVMKVNEANGIFLVFDFGGGTLDIAVAENIDGRVTLLAHGGIQVCGGRDFDRRIVDGVARPWLRDNFKLPDDWAAQPDFSRLNRLIDWATERAKIELSAGETSVISLQESDTRLKDLRGDEIYLDIPLSRGVMDKLISKQIDEAVDEARATLSNNGLSANDLSQVVFIGGPTNYLPLREKVCRELGVKGFTGVNPMTAVAEGASLFAESIDWSTRDRARKSSRGRISLEKADLGVSFNFMQRTPAAKAKIAARLDGQAMPGAEFQVDSLDTGWTSGRRPLENGAIIEVVLAKMGENTFKVFVFDRFGGPISLSQDMIVISRTAATVDAIPASHTISVEALDKLGGVPNLVNLIRKGDSLPKKGKTTFKAAEVLKAGSSASINFKLWEGDIEDPIEYNRSIGVMKISGAQFNSGVIHKGADLICEYEVRDSGQIFFEVSVPCIGSTFPSGQKFYSRQEGQLDFSADAGFVLNEALETTLRLHRLNMVADPRLEEARSKLESVMSANYEERDPGRAIAALEEVQKSRSLMAQVRKERLKEIRTKELDGAVDYFNSTVRKCARPAEAADFDSQVKAARRSIDLNDKDFETRLSGLGDFSFQILFRQDWYAVEIFRALVKLGPSHYTDFQRFKQLAATGEQLLAKDDIRQLRGVIGQLFDIRLARGFSEQDLLESANIIRG